MLDLHEAAIKYMYNMPRIWLDYAEFAANDCQLITQTRDIYDRALQTLPVTQHRKIWQSYANWALNLGRQDYDDTSVASLLHESTLFSSSPVFSLDPQSCEIRSLFTVVSLPILWRFIKFDPSSREAFANYLLEMDCLEDLIALYHQMSTGENFQPQGDAGTQRLSAELELCELVAKNPDKCGKLDVSPVSIIRDAIEKRDRDDQDAGQVG